MIDFGFSAYTYDQLETMRDSLVSAQMAFATAGVDNYSITVGTLSRSINRTPEGVKLIADMLVACKAELDRQDGVAQPTAVLPNFNRFGGF